MTTILALGFLLGMRHAVEADHVAAVATLAGRCRNSGQAVWQGAVWGLGHTITLFCAYSLVLFVDTLIPERLAQGLEAAVGVMLVLLGADLLRRLLRDRIHFHVHRHGNGRLHWHAHSHAGEDTHAHTIDHEHDHPRRFPARALWVGMVHGLAGSAALILLTVGTVGSPMMGLAYVSLFGAGSIAGMALLSLAISVPLQGMRRIAWLYDAVLGSVGIATIVLGAMLTYQNLFEAAT